MADFEWSIQVFDVGGNDSTFGGNMVADTLADAITELQALAETISANASANPLINGRIGDVKIAQLLSTAGWTIKAAAAAASENQKGGRFILSAGTNPPRKITFATFNEYYKLANGYINTADAAVIALNNLLINGTFADNRFEPLTTVRSSPYFTYGGKPAFK